MPLKKVKVGSNMYQGWVTHTHSHLLGKCPHCCRYCYVQALEKRFPTGMYSGDIRLNEKEFAVCYGSDKAIFIEHMNDMFSEGVQEDFIKRILKHCSDYPNNEYVFQTKNPNRLLNFINFMPPKYMVGTTVETDYMSGHGLYDDAITPPPNGWERLGAMANLPQGIKRFITIEPIVKFCSAKNFASAIAACKPDFINIGADSKRSDLEEPTKEDILEFVSELNKHGVTIRKKVNLARILDE